jgi:hypothetical protein
MSSAASIILRLLGWEELGSSLNLKPAQKSAWISRELGFFGAGVQARKVETSLEF